MKLCLVMVIRSGDVTDIAWVFCGVGNEVSHIYSTLHRCNYGSVISQLRVLAIHTESLGSVAQGAVELQAL